MSDEMMDELCNLRNGFRMILYLAVFVFGLMLLWLPFVEPQTGTRVVVIINLIGSSGFILFAGFFLWRCRQQDRKRKEQIRKAR